MKIKSALLMGLGAVGLCVAGASTSQAELPRLGNPCLTATANQTITIGPDGAVTSDISYAESACRGYIVDVKIQSIPAGYDFRTDGGIATVPSNLMGCELATENVAYFRKPAGATSFTAAGGGYRRGSWTGNTGQLGANTCNMAKMSGFVDRSGGAAAGDTWRVVVRATHAAEVAPVKVGASTMEVPR